MESEPQQPGMEDEGVFDAMYSQDTGVIVFPPIEDAPDAAGKVDALIEKAERNLLALYADVERGWSSMGEHPPGGFRHRWRTPFRLLEFNRAQNACRNAPAIRKAQAATPVMRGMRFAHIPDVQFFAFDLLMHRRSVATFHTASRSIKLADTFSEHSPLHGLFAYHELVHAWLDGKMRQQSPTIGEYFVRVAVTASRPGGPPRASLDEEVTAYGIELEALNLLLRGQLESAGSKALDVVSAALGAQPEEQRTVRMLLNLARTYFPFRTQVAPDVPPAPFVNAVAQCLREGGIVPCLADGHPCL